MKEKMILFSKKCFKTLKPARWISPKCFEKKIPFGRNIPPFSSKVQNLTVFFNYLHDSNSMSRVGWINSENVPDCTVLISEINLKIFWDKKNRHVWTKHNKIDLSIQKYKIWLKICQSSDDHTWFNTMLDANSEHKMISTILEWWIDIYDVCKIHFQFNSHGFF